MTTNSKIGYTRCSGLIVTLEILGQTNESRENVVDPDYARFRTDYVKVLEIKPSKVYYPLLNTNQSLMTVKNDTPNYTPVEFILGSTIKILNYNPKAECGPGIDYFKTLEAAEQFHELIREQEWYNFTGVNKEYNRHGKYTGQSWYQDGKFHCLDGPAVIDASGDKYWYQNGQLNDFSFHWDDEFELPQIRCGKRTRVPSVF